MRHLACLSIAIAGVVASRPARADTDRQVGIATWGVAGAEVSAIGYYTLRFHYSDAPVAAYETPIPLVFAGGLAAAAYAWNFDDRPALATHGAVWAGTDLFLVGMMIDGRHDRTGLRRGPASLVLGAVGAVAGGLLGATAGDRWPAAWLGAPPIGLAAGGLVGGVAALALGDLGGDRTLFRFSVGAAVGVTAGLVFATLGGFEHRGSAPAATPRTATIEPGSHQMVVSVGGAF